MVHDWLLVRDRLFPLPAVELKDSVEGCAYLFTLLLGARASRPRSCHVAHKSLVQRRWLAPSLNRYGFARYPSRRMVKLV